MDTAQRINDARSVASQLKNWGDYAFDWQKAYVACVFSRVACLRIPAYEIKNADRANLIPCQEYRAVSASRSFAAAQQFLRGADFGELFIIERPYVVVVIAKIAGIVFVALRGTQDLYDWKINLDARRSRIHPTSDSLMQVHNGFHKVIASCMDEIFDTVNERLSNAGTVYITGHSLGGALAALLYGLWDSDWYGGRRGRRFRRHRAIQAHSCYTFGMPRYGNFQALFNLAQPFHVYNELDIVPTVPPRLMGYADCSDEYCLNSMKRLVAGHLKGDSYLRFVYGLATLKAIGDHDMEVYIDRVYSAQRNGAS